MTEIVGKIRGEETLRQKTLKLLTNAILSGKIKPGERLNETELAKKLQVSRAPVREALQRLHEQGLIVSVPRQGMFVVSLDEESIQKINSLRLLLEAEALRLARAHASAKQKEKLEQLTDKMEGMSSVPTNQMVRVDMEFHRMIWKLSRSEYLERILVSLTAPLFAHSMLSMFREEKRQMVLDSHRPLMEFVLGKSEEPAEKVILAHLNLRWQGPAKFSSLDEGARSDGSEI